MSEGTIKGVKKPILCALSLILCELSGYLFLDWSFIAVHITRHVLHPIEIEL